MAGDNKKLKFDTEFMDEKDSNQASSKRAKKQESSDKNSNVRPWVRYWARYLDIVIFAFVFGLFSSVFIPSILDSSEIFLMILILFVWAFVESILLSNWGTTPGKWILRVQLKGQDGGKPEFSKALNRSFAVWFRGLGFGIPIITLFTVIASYNRLTKKGITSWDEKGHFTVTHGKVGVVRTIVAILITVGAIFLAYGMEAI